MTITCRWRRKNEEDNFREKEDDDEFNYKTATTINILRERDQFVVNAHS